MKDESKPRGRVAEFDPAYVKRLAAVMLTIYYNDNPGVLAARLQRDPTHLSKFETYAIPYERMSRMMLRAFRDHFDDIYADGDQVIERLAYHMYLDGISEENDMGNYRRNVTPEMQLLHSACYTRVAEMAARAKYALEYNVVPSLVLPEDTQPEELEDDTL